MTALPPPIMVETDEGLRAMMGALAGQPLVAVDTESNSLYAYRERVCLVQVSSRVADYIVDPLAGLDLTPFGVLLADATVEKVFHAAEYDLLCLGRDYGFAVNNLFDTSIAARVVGLDSFGLDKLLARYFGLAVDKSHQRDNWAQRPLPESSLRYAQQDTHYLPMLRDTLVAELDAIGRRAEADELFAEASRVTPVLHTFDAEGYWKLARPARIKGRALAALRELYLWRERTAQAMDVPPFRVMDNKVLLAVAQALPRRESDLYSTAGLPNALARRWAGALLDAVARGQEAPVPASPSLSPPPDPVLTERFNTLQQWRKQRAAERGVMADIIVSKDVLWHVARTLPATLEELDGVAGLGPWRLAMYGADLLAQVAVLRANGNADQSHPDNGGHA